jgi:hypothetical protein
VPVGIADCLEQMLAVWAVRRGLERRLASRDMPRCLDRIAVTDVDDGSPAQALLLVRDGWWGNVVESLRRNHWLVGVTE